MTDHAGSRDELFVRATWSGRLGRFSTLGFGASFVIGVAMVVGAGVPLGLRVLGVALVVASAVVGWRIWRRPGMLVTSTGAVLRGVWSTRTVSWTDVAAISSEWGATRMASGWFVSFDMRPGRSRVWLGVPVVGWDAGLLRDHLRRHAPEVLVNPEEPWRDRFGRWHGEFHEFEPTESIRTVRRAAVGPYVIRVEPSGDGFRAVTTDPAGVVVRESSVYADLTSATEAALEQIRQAQSET